MATKKIYIGSTGPFLYDDANSFPDATPHGIVTEGVMRAGVAPAVATDVLRLGDLGGAGGVAPSDAQYVVLAVNPSLTVERVLTGTVNQIVITDNGAGSTVVLSLPQDLDVAAVVQFGTLDIGGTIVLTGTLDEDNMVSDSAVSLATQQSIKAYVDTEVSGASGNEFWQSPVVDKDLTAPPI